MTEDTINVLIKLREHATNKRDEQIAWGAVDLIDAQLRKVPPGQRNDVDLLLGRTCAVLPPDEAIKVSAAQSRVTAELTPQQVAQLEARTAECSGIVENDDATAGMWM